MSRRISLSPFRTPDIIPDLPDLIIIFHFLLSPSTTLSAHSVHSVHSAITIPSLSANSSTPVSTRFPSPRLYPFPVSLSLSVSRLPVSIRFPSPRLYLFPVSIRFSLPLPVQSAGRSAVLPPINLPITDRCCLAIIPCYSVTFPYIKPYTMVVRPQFVID